ncbi:MAG: nucleotidyltransferase family protein [Anaerolineae bacterium]|nr:nucleotidyltransferase family protein [Anaerolineae bacterium]
MISAIVLAAGKSTRMGQQKMLMPWGNTTVLGRVIRTLQDAGMEDIVLVTHSDILPSVEHLPIRVMLNDDGDMLSSLKAGVRIQKPAAQATLICLGDQPQMEERSVRSVCEAFVKSGANLVVPSYQMRRGHPWLAARPLWEEMLGLQDVSLREFLNAHSAEIEYVPVETPTVLQDLDTPEDYLKYKPSL